MKIYHLEFDHPDWASLSDTHYDRFIDAVAAHDRIFGLPDGVTRVLDELGLVHAELHVPPRESVPETEHSAFGPLGAVEMIATALLDAEESGEFDQELFFQALSESRGMLNLLEERGRKLIDTLRHHGRCCMIVEDEPTVRRGIERMARSIGFTRVLTCRSVGELCDLIDDVPPMTALTFPNVVVSDYDLPDGRNGAEAQALIRDRAQQRGAKPPLFIAYSSSDANLARMDGVRILKDHVSELDAALRNALSAGL